MNQLNSVLIEGNMERDPEFSETAEGMTVCTFSITSNRFFKKNEELEKEVNYFDVETWAKLAESCKKLGHKGRGVRVVGRLKQSFLDDVDGKNYSKIIIVAEHVEFRSDFLQEESQSEGEEGNGKN
jgi:single-strand DNA-binding protein